MFESFRLYYCIKPKNNKNISLLNSSKSLLCNYTYTGNMVASNVVVIIIIRHHNLLS